MCKLEVNLKHKVLNLFLLAQVESGTAGYLGQVTVIKKAETECYDCEPKPHQKSFPGKALLTFSRTRPKFGYSPFFVTLEQLSDQEFSPILM